MLIFALCTTLLALLPSVVFSPKKLVDIVRCPKKIRALISLIIIFACSIGIYKTAKDIVIKENAFISDEIKKLAEASAQFSVKNNQFDLVEESEKYKNDQLAIEKIKIYQQEINTKNAKPFFEYIRTYIVEKIKGEFIKNNKILPSISMNEIPGNLYKNPISDDSIKFNSGVEWKFNMGTSAPIDNPIKPLEFKILFSDSISYLSIKIDDNHVDFSCKLNNLPEIKVDPFVYETTSDFSLINKKLDGCIQMALKII